MSQMESVQKDFVLQLKIPHSVDAFEQMKE